jgi:hypothetical protein
MHLHPHLPHPHLPHLDPRGIGHEAAVAAEVAIAALVIGAAIEGHALLGRVGDLTHRAATSAPVPTAPAPAAAAVAASAGSSVPTLELLASDTLVTARVQLPAAAHGEVALVDAQGTEVGRIDLDTSARSMTPPAAGTYVLVLHEEGAIETFGDAAVSSAVVLRSAPFSVASGATVQVLLDR